MKRWITFILFVLLSVGNLIHAQEKEEEMPDEDEIEQQLYQAALKALEDQTFVFEADQLIFKTGVITFVNPNTNFIMEAGKKSTVQVAFNTSFSGPNGIGGITVDGNTTNYKMKVKKKGDVDCSFNSSGIGISAQITISMRHGSNSAMAIINPNFNNQRLTMRGRIVPLEVAAVYMARTL